MRFISDGDFIFPFEAYFYNIKHLFIWSYQSGAANPDGIIRLPGRALYLLIFSWFGNISVAYFFLLSSLAIVGVAFYYFCRVFLHNVGPPVAALCALLFTLNPIFLGNLAKIGLVVAAAMLPPSLAVISRAFERQRIRYLLLWLLFLNISLIHPFTFTVNFLVTFAYFAYQCKIHRAFARHNFGRFMVIGAAGVLMNAYFILPLASMGTVSKDALSSSVTNTPTNYTSLVNVANTGDIFTGLSLSKNVLKDFEFYSPVYQNFYFLGVFVIYIVLLGIYVRVEDRMKLADKKRFGVFMTAFLTLVLLATVKFWHIDNVIKFVIGLPGGWMFRSPLKWQLYIPLVLFGMLAIVLVNLKTQKYRRTIYLSLGISFLLMNGFILSNIYSDLLKPREMQYFHALAALPADHKNLLIVGSERCFSFADSNPEVMTELNQVLISKQLQVKHVGIGDIDNVNLSSYSYILGCQNTFNSIPTDGFAFKLEQEFLDGAFQLYKNASAQPYMYASADILALDQPRSLNKAAAFVGSTLDKPFLITDISTKQAAGKTTSVPPAIGSNATGLQDVFDKLAFEDLNNGKATAIIRPIRGGEQTLYIQQETPLFYKQTRDELALSTVQHKDYSPIPAASDSETTVPTRKLELNLEANKDLQVTYQDPAYSYINLIANPSLEKGLWQKEVGDCYSYDNQPDIAMSMVRDDASDGQHSLQLRARHHIACTGPSEIAVKPGQHYLLSLDFKNIGGQFGGYYINFDDQDQTVLNGRLRSVGSDWENFTKNITIPEGATRMRIILYSYPDSSGTTYGTVRYDHFRLATIPEIQGRFFLVGTPADKLVQPKAVDYTVENPARSTVRVTGASTPFFLGTHESYNPNWQLAASSTSDPAGKSAIQHFKLNSSMNGWYVDPEAICTALGPSSKDCSRNPDGSYNLILAMSFKPQRLVYLGGALSGAVFLAMAAYYIINYSKDKQTRHIWIAKAFRRKQP